MTLIRPHFNENKLMRAASDRSCFCIIAITGETGCHVLGLITNIKKWYKGERLHPL